MSASVLSLTYLVATLDHCETLMAAMVTVVLPSRLGLALGACDVCSSFGYSSLGFVVSGDLRDLCC